MCEKMPREVDAVAVSSGDGTFAIDGNRGASLEIGRIAMRE